ncbi:MAG: hypothetical protein H7343_10520 [Undibacterium sp.]|nr:hypothetical protein [Opitutaceae bacterium]
MPDDPADPPRKFYGLKPRAFDAVNYPAHAPLSDASPTGPDPGIARAADTAPITVEALNRTAAGEQPALGVNGPVNRANEVHDMLELNRRLARQSGAFELKPLPPRRSRRKRDFWILVALANGGCVGFTGLVTRFNPAVMAFGLGAGLFLTLALTWIMWFVMDDY